MTKICKYCGSELKSKESVWMHLNLHVKADKILRCNQCEFVTTHKHHLDYHVNNHSGTKPYSCQHCDYRSLTKTMLKSHLKSHSTNYEYQCGDCKYLTKYSHSMKQHLNKYNHSPFREADNLKNEDPHQHNCTHQYILDLRINKFDDSR